MSVSATYAIGTPGVAWGEAEVSAWLARRRVKRSYADDVLSRIEAFRSRHEVFEYGRLDYPPYSYVLHAIKSRHWDDALPCMLVTGGVHGYETSGVHGALQFVETRADDYAGRCNLLLAPCVSPWGYERIQRWNAEARDPNRSFHTENPTQESAALMQLLASLGSRIVMHIDLHETTDSDESEFRPALAARDGVDFVPGVVPDGFYLCGDSENPKPAFQQVVIAAVAKVTHIAPADANGEIIGSPLVAPGVIDYPLKQWGLCAGMTNAPYRTTTEVYPDSPCATDAQCNDAQVAAVCGAIDFVLAPPVT